MGNQLSSTESEDTLTFESRQKDVEKEKKKWSQGKRLATKEEDDDTVLVGPPKQTTPTPSSPTLPPAVMPTFITSSEPVVPLLEKEVKTLHFGKRNEEMKKKISLEVAHNRLYEFLDLSAEEFVRALVETREAPEELFDKNNEKINSWIVDYQRRKDLLIAEKHRELATLFTPCELVAMYRKMYVPFKRSLSQHILG